MAARVLVTAFAPFGGRRRNESGDALRAVHASGRFRGRARFVVLPVSWRRGVARLLAEVRAERPSRVLLLGEAGSRSVVTPEAIARNRARRLRDEDGALPARPRLSPSGPARRAATWDPHDLVRALRGAGIRSRVSRDAGAFLCNAVFYRALGALPDVPVAFVHLPVPCPRGARVVRAVLEGAFPTPDRPPTAPRRRRGRR
jgi:pyroglutamyl-peptidase